MEEDQIPYKVGTLIEDLGKLGVIVRVIKNGALQTKMALINWRLNYEIYYFDGMVTIMGHETFNRLIDNNSIKVLVEVQQL